MSRPIHEALWHWSSDFDADAIIAAFSKQGLQGDPAYVTNFIGTRIEPAVFPPVLSTMLGHVEPPPAPGNWHADIAEWASALFTVQHAAARGDTYRIVELGCGWGCWMTNMGVAARGLGLNVDLVGVEGEAQHLANASRTLELNGFTSDQFKLMHGVAGPKIGYAIFPKAGIADAGWGGEAVFYPEQSVLSAARQSRDVQVLDCMTLEQLSNGKLIDLLHIDIQGAEVDFITGNFEQIEALVRYVLIGTHSREIEGALIQHFLAAGWRLKTERPAICTIVSGRLRTEIDGVQLWANPRTT